MLGDFLQIIDDDLHEAFSGRDLGMLCEDLCDASPGQDFDTLLMNGTKVIGLQAQGGKRFFHGAQGLGECAEIGAARPLSAGDAGHSQEFLPGHGNGIHLSHIRKDLVDVAAEDGI